MNTMTDTVAFETQPAFGMPVVDRARVQLCHLPVTTGVVEAPKQESSARTQVDGPNFAPTDAVITGAFAGAPAWSRPI